jgi:hypothetical protein
MKAINVLTKLCLPAFNHFFAAYCFPIPQVQSQLVFDIVVHPNQQAPSLFILDIIVHQSPPILQLLFVENQLLLRRKDTFFLLDLSLDMGDAVRALHLKRDDSIGHRVPNEDLHI